MNVSEDRGEDRVVGARVELRPIGPGDAAALQEVFAGAGAAVAENAAERELAAGATTPGRRTALVVERATGGAVGAVGWWEGHPEPEVALLGMLMIVRDARRRGLAREVVEGVGGWLRGRGIRRLRTGAGAGDRRAHDFLRAVGFHPLDARTHVSMDQGRMMISLFEKEL